MIVAGIATVAVFDHAEHGREQRIHFAAGWRSEILPDEREDATGKRLPRGQAELFLKNCDRSRFGRRFSRILERPFARNDERADGQKQKPGCEVPDAAVGKNSGASFPFVRARANTAPHRAPTHCARTAAANSRARVKKKTGIGACN